MSERRNESLEKEGEKAEKYPRSVIPKLEGSDKSEVELDDSNEGMGEIMDCIEVQLYSSPHVNGITSMI